MARGRGRGRGRSLGSPPRKRGRPRKYNSPTKDDIKAQETVNKVIRQEKKISVDIVKQRNEEIDLKLPPLKIHKSRFVRSLDMRDDDDDDDKTPEYPLAEDSYFKFTQTVDNEQSRNVFSAMYFTMSSKGTECLPDNEEKTDPLDILTQVHNDINTLHSERLSDTASVPKIKRLQIIPKLKTKDILPPAPLQELPFKEMECKNEAAEKQEEKIPRLSPVEETDTVDVLCNSQPPKLKRICEDKVLFKDSISTAVRSEIEMNSTENDVSNHSNLNGKRSDDASFKNVQNSSFNHIVENHKNQIRTGGQTQNEPVITTDNYSIEQEELMKQSSSDSPFDLSATSKENILYSETSYGRTNTTESYDKLKEAISCPDKSSTDILQSQDVCGFESISEDELSPAPLMIDEHGHLENSFKKSSYSEVMEAAALTHRMSTNGLGDSLPAQAPVAQSSPSGPLCEPLSLALPPAVQTPPSHAHSSLLQVHGAVEVPLSPAHSIPSPSQNALIVSQLNLKNSGHTDFVICNNQLNAWMTNIEPDDFIDASNFKQPIVKPIPDIISSVKDNQKDNSNGLDGFKKMCGNASNVNGERDKDNKTASGDSAHPLSLHTTSFITNDHAFVSEGTNQLDHEGNSFFKTQSRGFPAKNCFDSPDSNACNLDGYSGCPLTHMDSREDVIVEHTKKKSSQEPVALKSQPKRPGRPRKSLNKETDRNTRNKYQSEHFLKNSIDASHHEANRTPHDSLGITHVRRRTQKYRNQLPFVNNDNLEIRDETYSQSLMNEQRGITSSEKTSNSSNVNARPVDSYSQSFERDIWQYERNKANIVAAPGALYVGQDTLCAANGRMHLKTTDANFVGLKEIRPHYSMPPAAVHHNMDGARSEMPPPFQHGYGHSLQLQQPLQNHQPFPNHGGHKQFVLQEPSQSNTHSLSQFYPASTYRQLGARALPGVESSSSHCPPSGAQRNYPSATHQYLHSEQIPPAWPPTVNANISLHPNQYVNAANKSWSSFDTNLQNSSMNCNRQPYVALHGRKDYLHSDRLLPPSSQYFNQAVRPETMYHRKVSNACPVSSGVVPNFMPTTAPSVPTVPSVPNVMPTAIPSVPYHRSGDSTSMPTKFQQPQNHFVGHQNAFLASSKQRQQQETVLNPRDRETMYPSWVRVPDMSKNDKNIQHARTSYFDNFSTSVHPKNVFVDGVFSQSATMPQLTKTSNSHDMISENRMPELQLRTFRNGSQTNSSVAGKTGESNKSDEPLDLSVSSKNYNQVSLRRNSQETYSRNLIGDININELSETNSNIRNGRVLRNDGSCDLDIPSNILNKTGERIGNLFKDSSSSEQQIAENSLQTMNLSARDLSGSRASISDISCRDSSVSDSSSISSNLLVATSSPDTTLLSPSGWTHTAPRVSRSSSRTSIDSVEVTPPRKIGLPLEHFLNSTPSKTTYSSMMMAHITSKAKKPGMVNTITDDYENHLMFSNRVNNSVIDLTEGGDDADVVSVSSYDSYDEESRIAFITSEENIYEVLENSEPSQPFNEPFERRTVHDSSNWTCGQSMNHVTCNSLKVNRAMKESMAAKVKEVVSMHSSSQLELTAQGVSPLTASNDGPSLPCPVSSADLTPSPESLEPSTEQAAATLMMLSTNPLYNNNVIMFPETSEGYQEKVYQIQPMLGEEDNSNQELQNGKDHVSTTRSGTKTGRRVGRPPKDEVWPQRNEERPEQHGASTFAGNFDPSVVQSTNAVTMSLQHIPVNGSTDLSDSFYQVLNFPQQTNMTLPLVTSFRQPPSSAEKKIDPKVAQLMKFRLRKSASEMAKKSLPMPPGQVAPSASYASSTPEQTSLSTSLVQDGIIKKKRKRRTKKEMMEAALLLSQNPNKKTRNKYRPRQKRKYSAVQQTAFHNDPTDKEIVENSFETRPGVSEIVLTSYISPPATPELTSNLVAPLDYPLTKQALMQNSLHKNSYSSADVNQVARQSSNDELMNIEQFNQHHVVTEARNEDGLVVISLQPAQVDQLEHGLISPSRLDARLITDTTELPQAAASKDIHSPITKMDQKEEEVIDWLTKNRKM